MSVIIQDGDSALMRVAYWGHTETVTELVKAKANLDLQNNVWIQCPCTLHVHVVTALYGHYFAVYMYNDYM